MVKTVLLIPIKILAKALGYIAAAIIVVAAWIIGFAGLMIGKITPYIGLIIILMDIILLASGYLDKKYALFYGLYGVGAILFPVMIKEFIKLMFSSKEKLMDHVKGIKLI